MYIRGTVSGVPPLLLSLCMLASTSGSIFVSLSCYGNVTVFVIVCKAFCFWKTLWTPYIYIYVCVSGYTHPLDMRICPGTYKLASPSHCQPLSVQLATVYFTSRMSRNVGVYSPYCMGPILPKGVYPRRGLNQLIIMYTDFLRYFNFY